jgi:large subunit ribosomal protein L19
VIKSNSLFKKIYLQQSSTNLPRFRVGDSLKVEVFYQEKLQDPGKISKGSKKSAVHKIKKFHGILISRKGSLLDENITILHEKGKSSHLSDDEVVEITFPVHSPLIKSIEIDKEGRHKRAKLYYLRDLRGNKRKLKVKRK